VRLVRAIKQRHRRLDVVVNNAGVASMNHSLLTPAATVSELLDGNLRSSFVVSREGAKLMRRSGGRIINMSSVAVPLRLQGQSAYVAAKAGVESMSQVLARELGAFGITVNVIGVSPVPTSMLRGVPSATIDKLVDRLPIRRLGTLDDILNVLDFLVRPESDAITGQVIYLGGVH
jgi:3-oxoacyl-[acyl-carrier protein] reductase